MGATQWLVQEGKCKVVHENYSNARDAYLDAVKRNKKLRASDSIFDRVKAKRIEFRPLN